MHNESINCPVCSAVGPFNEVDVVGDYKLFRCNSCRLEFAEFMNYDPLYYENFFYAEDYNLDSISGLSRDDFTSRAKKLSMDDNWQPYNMVLKWINNNFNKAITILDIGCGVGNFIAVLESSGFHTVGIEVSPKIVEMLRNKGFQVHLGPLDAISIEIQRPDLIVMLGVIEHVEDPVGLLQNINLRFPQAALLFTVPSPKRWDFAMGIRNYWDYPPNHLTPVWSEEAVEIALRKSGYPVIKWLFPQPTGEEVWFAYFNLLLFNLDLRKKGYFVGLTNIAARGRGRIKSLIILFYPALFKIYPGIMFFMRPLLNKVAAKLRRRGYSGLSAIVVANPRVE